MQEELQLIAKALNREYVEHSFIGPNFTNSKVSDAIKNASINKDDIVIQYFSTHGAKSRWDTNIFPQVDIPEDLVAVYNKHKEMVLKRPQSVITIIEACSGFLDITPQQAFVLQQADNSIIPTSPTQSQIDNIKKLFSPPCNLIITAGNPGKNTWATSNGSMFTNCFLRAMNEYIDMPPVDIEKVVWDNLLNQAKQYTWDMSGQTRHPKIQYYPVWEKDNCQSTRTEQNTVDTTKVKDYGITFDLVKTKTERIKNPYDIDLKIIKNNSSNAKISRVTYYLHKTMKNPIVDTYNKAEDFALSLAVWGSFPIKAKVFLENGEIIELYQDFNIDEE